MDSRDHVILWVNGSKKVLRDVEPHTTLLQWLRSVGLSGTKLGCGEGGCGACTVAVSSYRAKDDAVVHRAVNACITPVCAMDCCSITTVEGIGSSRSTLHPVQASSHSSIRVALRCDSLRFTTAGPPVEMPRQPVRVLHARLRHVDVLPVGQVSHARPTRRRGNHRRQSVPLHRLSPDPRCVQNLRLRLCVIHSAWSASGHHCVPGGAALVSAAGPQLTVVFRRAPGAVWRFGQCGRFSGCGEALDYGQAVAVAPAALSCRTARA